MATTKAEAPARIWVDKEELEASGSNPEIRLDHSYGCDDLWVKYVRADLVADLAPAGEKFSDFLAEQMKDPEFAAAYREVDAEIKVPAGESWWCCKADYPNHEPSCKNAPAGEKCEWVKDEDRGYLTTCGGSGNNFNFCPFCGKEIK